MSCLELGTDVRQNPFQDGQGIAAELSDSECLIAGRMRGGLGFRISRGKWPPLDLARIYVWDVLGENGGA